MAQVADTRQTVPLAVQIATRDGTLNQDAKIVNGMIETTDNGTAVVKRPGNSIVNTFAGTPQGQFVCNAVAYSIVSDIIYNTTTGASYAIPGVTASNQPYDCVSDVPLGTSIIKSASGLWTFTSASLTAVKVTDANYPAMTVPGIAYLDGVFYVMSEAGVIQGSALEDQTTWPPLDFIQADLSLGAGGGILRHLNYVVAFYQHGTQFYYDADAAPNGEGIALGPVGNASWTTGCAGGRSIIEMSDLSTFLAQDRTHGRTIQQLNGTTMSQISTPFVERILNQSNLEYMQAFGLRTSGHPLYGINLPDLGLCLVYDNLNSSWYVWQSVINGVASYFAYTNYLQDGPADYMQDFTTGNTVLINPEVYTDTVGSITVTVVTPQYDWDITARKRFKELDLRADTANTVVNVSYTDDDYNTYSTPRQINMQTYRKKLINCGSSRLRAWKLTHTDNTPLRLFNMKLDMSVGP